MQPTQYLFNRIMTLLAGDSTTLAQTSGVSVHLCSNSIAPALGTTLNQLTECTFAGYAAIRAQGGAQDQYQSLTNGNYVVELNPPAGGFVFNVGNITSAQQITGYYVTDAAVSTLYCCNALPGGSVTATTSGQAIDLGPLTLTFNQASPF